MDTLAAFQQAIEESRRTVVLNSVQDVEREFEKPQVGIFSEVLCDALRRLICVTQRTGFDTHHLRKVAGGFHLQDALNGSKAGRADVISVIAACLQAGSELKPPSDPVWVRAATIGRALIVLGSYWQPDQRHVAVAEAAKRLVIGGYNLQMSGTMIDVASPAIKDVTKAISDRLERLGLYGVLTALCSMARRAERYEFDQYLFGRHYAYEERKPSIPFGFLFNLAARAGDHDEQSSNPDADWNEAVALSRDLVGILDVEPYNQFWMINQSPTHMGNLLEEVGLYDHLFGLRQWPIFITPLLLEHFFGTEHDAKLKAHIGWGASDAVQFSAALVREVRTDPTRLAKADMLVSGLEIATVDRMLQRFAHEPSQANRAYNSPLQARSADLMFRPLLAAKNDTFIAAAASMVGPACYEVLAAAHREALSPSEMADLVGKGTERAVAALLRFRGLLPTFEGAKYNEGKSVNSGECDVVLESGSEILLIECKGKALTRATMAAEPGAALLDYAGGVLASQAQALQHERLLHDCGEIIFDDGRCLQLKGRRTTRLSVTLLDHGSLQDRFLFVNLVEALLRSKVVFDPKDKNRKRLQEVNAELDRHRHEMAEAGRRSKSPWEQALGAASLSFGQLATILVKANTVGALVESLRRPATAATMNPLLEYLFQTARRQ